MRLEHSPVANGSYLQCPHGNTTQVSVKHHSGCYYEGIFLGEINTEARRLNKADDPL